MRKLFPLFAVVLLVSVMTSTLFAQPPAARPGFQGPGSRPGRPGLALIATQGEETGPTAQSLPKDDVEAKILEIIERLDREQRRGNMNVPLQDGRLLRVLTEATGAKNVVEIGTSNGFSGLWFCLALRKTEGKLTTFDIDEGRLALARANFAEAGVEEMITIVQGDAHELVLDLEEPIDILFIDADKEGYPDYLTKLLPLVKPGGLICGHNMTRPTPSPEYIEMITTNPELETLFLNMSQSGIAVSLKKR
jgi:caffeoyl-CoA O-methyltransferase